MTPRGIAAPRQQTGALTITPEDGSPVVEIPTITCCHCGRVWQWIPGSGRNRGFCLKCNAFFCGPQCQACVPQEQQLENLEAGRPVDYRPVKVLIPGTPTAPPRKVIDPNAPE